MPATTLCPSCGQEAPIVYRGVVPYCTACGATRAPLSGASVNLAGKPSRVGGAVATVAGGLVMVFGVTVALASALLLLALGRPIGAIGFGVVVTLATLVAAIALVRRGKSLARSAADTEAELRTQAVLAMAAHRGAVTARDAAQALGTSVAEADAMLTELAKRDPERVAVDVDDQGNVWYRVAARPGEAIPRMRVDAQVRVDDPGAREADASEAADPARRKAGP